MTSTLLVDGNTGAAGRGAGARGLVIRSIRAWRTAGDGAAPAPAAFFAGGIDP